LVRIWDARLLLYRKTIIDLFSKINTSLSVRCGRGAECAGKNVQEYFPSLFCVCRKNTAPWRLQVFHANSQTMRRPCGLESATGYASSS